MKIRTTLALSALALALALIALPQSRGAAPAPTPAASPDTKQPFIRSLVLRADRIIADSSHPTILWLSQSTAAPYRPTAPIKLHLAIAPATPNAQPIKDLVATDITLRDLAARPIGLSAECDGIPDGNYRLIATLTEGDAPLATIEQSLWLVRGIDARRGPIIDRLAKISGHEGTKASILYPFDLARVINTGKRAYNAADMGLNEQNQPEYYDFAKGMQRSEELLIALEAGKDLLWQAKGDVKRAYNFTEAGEISPYRLYVPSTWDGKTPLPLVFVLHGNTRNENFYFDRNDGIIPKTAEKHGFMLAATFGYHPNGGYNYNSMTRGARGGAGAPAAGAAGARGGRGGGGGGGSNFLDGISSARLGELSEADAMHVFDLVRKEYPIDPKRTFLFGYSAGGYGGYYIGGKNAQNFAAMALGGAGANANTYPYFDTIKSLNIGMFVYYGMLDTGVQANSKNMVETMKQKGIDAVLKEYPGVDHDGGPAAGVADAFNFFDTHGRK